MKTLTRFSLSFLTGASLIAALCWNAAASADGGPSRVSNADDFLACAGVFSVSHNNGFPAAITLSWSGSTGEVSGTEAFSGGPNDSLRGYCRRGQISLTRYADAGLTQSYTGRFRVLPNGAVSYSGNWTANNGLSGTWQGSKPPVAGGADSLACNGAFNITHSNGFPATVTLSPSGSPGEVSGREDFSGGPNDPISGSCHHGQISLTRSAAGGLTQYYTGSFQILSGGRVTYCGDWSATNGLTGTWQGSK